MKFNNSTLNRDYKDILNRGFAVTKGTVGGNSIEVSDTLESYVYYDDSEARDADFGLLTKLISEHGA